MTRPGPTEHSRDASSPLSATLRSLAPEGVATGSRAISDADVEELHPIESALVARSRSRRRSEFASGRSLLKTMLDNDAPILRQPGGAPHLPAGAKASLAHDSEWVVASITWRTDITALGIDIEPDSVLTQAEQAIIVSDADHVDDPLLTFVQKEAVYKAWSSLGGRLLEHHEVIIRSGRGEFSGTVTHARHAFNGRHDIVDGRRVALVVAFADETPHAAG